MPKCEMCEKEVEKLLPMIYNNDETQMLCPNCWGWEGDRGDMEYEKQREEGI